MSSKQSVMSSKHEEYEAFIRAKQVTAPLRGFETTLAFSECLFPYQKVAVQWSLRLGRAALFMSYGLGKTLQQLEFAKHVQHHTQGRFLIVCPLGVRDEFVTDGKKIGVTPKFIRSNAEASEPGVYMTNYETVRDGKIDPRMFDGASLDEADVLRGFGGSKTFREFMRLFENGQVRYKLVATATPSPNEHIELLAYAAFLDVGDVGQLKTRFFKRNSEKADELTIHPHKEMEFWLWVASWAMFCTKPSDLDPAFDDSRHVLPKLNVHWHEINTDHANAGQERDGQLRLVKDSALGVSEAAREKRDSLIARVAKVKDLLSTIRADDGALNDQPVIWCDLNDEQRAIEKMLDEECITHASLYGSTPIDERESTIRMWKMKALQAFVSKPEMYGAGVNLQQSHTMFFVGIGFKAKDAMQAVHRIYRFLQASECHVHLVYTEAERNVRRTLERKWKQHDELVAKMIEIVRSLGLSRASLQSEMLRSMGVERSEVKTGHATMVNNDCVNEVSSMESDSVGLILTSIPFGNQYEYSPNYCYDERTEVLTKRGWLGFGDLKLDDQIATMNLGTRRAEWQEPSRIVWEHYRGPMLRFHNRNNFDLCVTPDHAMIVDLRVGNRLNGRVEKRFARVLACDIADNFVFRKWRMTNAPLPGSGVEIERVAIPQLPRRAKGPVPRVVASIGADDFMELAGWYLTEGYADALSSKHRGRITIAQSSSVNPENYQAIADLFRRIGLNPQMQKKAVVVHCESASSYLIQQFGSGSREKFIPRWVKDLHPRLLTILRDTMMKGDGSKTGYAYASVSHQLLDDFQEICLLTGWRAVVNESTVFIGRKQLFPEIRKAPSAIEYEGMIGCAKVPNGTIIVRRNGVPVVGGNCDFGHTDGPEHFFAQMGFLTPELLRVLKPGRIACVHVKDRVVPGGLTGLGFQSVYPFHSDVIEHFRKHGFAYMGMKTIVTDVVRENNQTYRLSYTEMCRDASKMGCGMSEYMLIFRKPPTDRSNGYADDPISREKDEFSLGRWQIDAHGFVRSSGNRALSPDDFQGADHDVIFQMYRAHSLANVYDYEHHVALCDWLREKKKLPVTFMLLQPQSWDGEVWTDIARMRTPNTLQAQKGREGHVCPFPFDIVDRTIELYSKPGEVVLDPFGGIGTTAMCAVKKGRKAISVELSSCYHKEAVAYVKSVERSMSVATLFDLDAGLPKREAS